tara:strand:+ start:137 stop:412 length:276 start_codon:yes stop_codon:yes gene_type:complete
MGLESVEIVLDCEDAFGIKLKDEDCSNVCTVGDLQELRVREFQAQHPEQRLSSITRRLMIHQIRVIVSETLGVDYDKTVPQARFVEDLKMP